MNVPVIELFRVCGDELITGPAGAITISGQAILAMMDELFTVDAKDKAELLREVKHFFSMILKIQAERNTDK